MATMASSSQSKRSVYDPVRALWVTAHPEELVRQALIQKMIGPLGYPRSLLVVEKQLKELPHLSTFTNLPERRVDLLVFSPLALSRNEFFPLLLIECKRGNMEDQALRQLIGYNTYIGAPYLALASQEGVRFFFDAEERSKELSFLPSYEELVNACCRNS